MGIRGLLSYIKKVTSYSFIESYHLQNTNVIIDGLNIVYTLHNASTANVDENFQTMQLGGDFDCYQHYVSQFFENLLQCQVTPIVIFDGIDEMKNHDESLTKMKNNIKRGFDETNSYYSPLIRNVFIFVLQKLNIKIVKCFFEADDTIAGIARILDCPVISCDTDFCLYNVKFIPYGMLCNEVQDSDTGKVMSCKIFRCDLLRKKFNRLHESLLPLAVILLENKKLGRDGLDHFKEDVLNEFFNHISSSSISIMRNVGHKKIEDVLNWLSNFQSFDDAVSALVKFVSINERETVSRFLVNIASKFAIPSIHVLRKLGLENESILKRKELQLDSKKNFLPTKQDIDVLTEEDLIAFVPDWLIQDMMSYNLPSLFINVIRASRYVLVPLTEDKYFPSTQEITMPLANLILTLLMSNKVPAEESTVELIMMEKQEFVHKNIIVPKSPVLLKDLRNLNIFERKKMIDDVWGITDPYILEYLPDDWKLYIGTAIFWMTHKIPPKRNKIHLMSLLFAMLFGIIDRKIGYVRSKQDLKRRFQKEINKKRKLLPSINFSKDDSVKTSLNLVTRDDCIGAAPFFIYHFHLRQGISELPWYAETIAHVFGQFQCCLDRSIELNSLLGRPYACPPIGDFFNGTLLFNLYSVFYEQSNIDAYICRALSDAPGLLRIFKLLLKVVDHALNEKN